MTIKEIIKLIPQLILNRLQTLRAKKALERFKNMNTKDIFSEIYQKGLWGKSDDPNQPFYSGSGSHDESVTVVYIEKVGAFLNSYPKKLNLVDLGCGDFSVGSQLRSYCNSLVVATLFQKS